jgi:hypothetical protein
MNFCFVVEINKNLSSTIQQADEYWLEQAFIILSIR